MDETKVSDIGLTIEQGDVTTLEVWQIAKSLEEIQVAKELMAWSILYMSLEKI